MLDGREISCHLAAEKNVRASQQQVHHGQQHRGGGARVYGSSAPSYSAWTSSAAGVRPQQCVCGVIPFSPCGMCLHYLLPNNSW